MYELQKVTLGDVEGKGYAFKRRTAFGHARKGIFFPDDEADLEKLKEEETLEFSGPCYYRKRGPRDVSFEATVFDVTSTGMGARADFEAVDNPEPVLESA